MSKIFHFHQQLLRCIIFIIYTLIFESCANISPPSGGPKDLKAPKLIRYNPENNTLNFNKNKISLTFNEKIQLNNIEDQLIINPTLKKQYIYTIKGNTLSIILKENLLKNTTYTLNFRDAIKDITENNITKNLYLAFSTGSDIDTNSINGVITDLNSNLPVYNALISIYDFNDTLTVKNSLPKYFTKTDKIGKYQIKNIKKGNYNIYAFYDINKNYFYDNENEKIGYENNSLIDGNNIYNIRISKNKFTKPKIINELRKSPNESQINFNKGLFDVSILDEKEHNFYTKLVNNGKTFLIITETALNDSVSVALHLEDSLGNTNDEKTIIHFNPSKDLKKTKKNNLFSPTITPTDLKLGIDSNVIHYNFNLPIKHFDKNKISVKIDSLVINDKKLKYNWNSIKTNLEIIIQDKFNDSIVLTINKGCFIDILNDSNRIEKFKLIHKIEADYAIIEGKIETDKKDIIIQLVNKEYKVIKEVFDQNKFRFIYIIPGTYYIRVIHDINKNKRWDAGNVLNNLKPEDIYLYSEKVELRANWEINGILFNF